MFWARELAGKTGESRGAWPGKVEGFDGDSRGKCQRSAHET